ncbi:hypothetical protein V3G39_09405 [Dermatophilaceae bacterium Sec6.4]
MTCGSLSDRLLARYDENRKKPGARLGDVVMVWDMVILTSNE